MCWKKAEGFILHPKGAFRKEQKTTLEDAFKFIMILTVVYAVLASAVAAALRGFSPFIFTAGAVGTYVFTIVVILLWSLWTHLWAYIFGARKGLVQTLKALFYAETPFLLLGWIPFVNFAAMVWGVILDIIGLREMQGLSTGRAVLAVLIPLVIVLVIAGIMIIALIGFVGMGNLGSIPGAFTYS